MSDGKDQKFIVDNMLGSLARWLRMLGYDASYDKDLYDDEIIERSRAEGRRILTRDRDLSERGDGFYVPATSLDEQLGLVSKEFSLTYRPGRMRCSVCNGSLRKVDGESVRDSVPKVSFDNAKEFWRCDSCGKVYWDGTHWNGIIDRFRRLGLLGDNA